ncbi:hypothetical protein GCK72_016849 [Caenorhabditis remanei]|uniref:Glutaredoxin domain-containing protein n=1 Tax=Caenorhabditis remanei TaxID=31234 RepID=A0A6A5G6G5_CAERE|nr:hypothetical protein GCK72_016849 [Caenorhabditis remanei]KAF1750301.1 hypothetical protein GCK72_016849 [Caenorhabditis remanei]
MLSLFQPTFELLRTWCPCFSKTFCCCCKNVSSEERTLLNNSDTYGGKELQNFSKPAEDSEDSEEEASRRRIAEHKKQLEEKRRLKMEKGYAEIAIMQRTRKEIENDVRNQEQRLSQLVQPRRSEGAGNGDEIVESSDDEEAQIHKEFQEKLKIQDEQYKKKLDDMRKRKLIRQEEHSIEMSTLKTERLEKLDNLLKLHSIFLFSSSVENEKESERVAEILRCHNKPFKEVPVDDDPYIRLAIKEFTGRSDFPLLLVGGQWVDTSMEGEFLSRVVDF